MKDIFIDNCVTQNFCNPPDSEYKRIISWLRNFDQENNENNAYLVVCDRLLHEYDRTCGSNMLPTNLVVIISQLTKEGRLRRITKPQIKEFKKRYFKKKIINRFTCNFEDRDYIPVVLLSDRKYALSLDNNFIFDLEHFPGFTVIARQRPQDIPYE